MAENAPRGGRRGLGRGLSVLLGEQPEVGAPGPEIRELRLDEITPHPEQPRRHIDPAALDALAESITQHGLMQPVVVRQVGDSYQLIAGERRWRAAQKAGLDRVPAVIRQADDRARLELALVENMVREDLSPIEVANAVAVLVEDFGQSHQQIATHLGRSRPAVSNLLRLLELPDDVQTMVDKGELTEGHGRAILMADGAKERTRLARQAAEGGWSVREVERRARSPRESGEPPEPRPERASVTDDVVDDAVDAFAGAFDVPTRVLTRTTGFVVELRFADQQALRAAIERLTES